MQHFAWYLSLLDLKKYINKLLNPRIDKRHNSFQLYF